MRGWHFSLPSLSIRLSLLVGLSEGQCWGRISGRRSDRGQGQREREREKKNLPALPFDTPLGII